MNNSLIEEIANCAAAYQQLPTPEKTAQKQKPAPSEKEMEVLQEAQKAWETYSNSEEGKTKTAELKTADRSKINDFIQQLIDHDTFRRLKQLLDELDLPACSFSVGINFEAELIIGVTGTIGMAFGIGNSAGAQSAEFLSLGITEGVDEGVMTGIQFALWNSAPSDIGGYAFSTEVDAGLGAEVALDVYYLTSILGVSLTVGAGEEEGVNEGESYTFILGSQGDDPYLKPIYQPTQNNLLIIENVKCLHPSNDGIGNANEIYFKFQADDGTIYPYPTYDYFSMQEGDVWVCGRSVWFNNYVNVTLYDEDDVSDPDVEGTFAINLSDLTLNQIKTFHSTKDYSHGLDDVEYTIDVKLVAQNVAHR